ncbi:hypothetical protein AB205_0184670, partial [Aquarana catesbeiana]
LRSSWAHAQWRHLSAHTSGDVRRRTCVGGIRGRLIRPFRCRRLQGTHVFCCYILCEVSLSYSHYPYQLNLYSPHYFNNIVGFMVIVHLPFLLTFEPAYWVP